MKRSKPTNSSHASKRKPSRLKRQTVREYHELQRLMAGAVMRRLGPGDTMQPRWLDGRSMKKVAGEFIKPNDRLTSFDRLEIYNRQYWFRVKGCFYDDYPGLRAILGDHRFERLACEYLVRYPSSCFTLRNLGQYLLKFLAAEPRWAGPHLKLALDMARLEWAHIEAFDNEAIPKLAADALLDLHGGKIHLKLQPHLTLLKLRHEVDEFLIELKHNSGLRSEASNARENKPKRLRSRLKKGLKSGIIHLAVHRHRDSVYYKRLTAGQFCLLSAMQSGASLEEACGELVGVETIDANLGTKIKQWFEDWASLGWFCGAE